MPLLPSFASTTLDTLSDRDKFAYAPYTSFGTGLTLSRFAYHLGTHLENFSQGLDNDRDCLGADSNSTYSVNNGTSTCAFYPSTTANVSGFYNASGTNSLANNYRAGMLPTQNFTTNTGGGAGTIDVDDFDGSDGNTQRCDATTDCVFDVNAQQ
jgi:hypothetical protein